MSDTGYKIRNQEAMHYLTFTVVYWLDIFTRPIYRDILIESFIYCQKEKGLIIYAHLYSLFFVLILKNIISIAQYFYLCLVNSIIVSNFIYESH